MKLKLLNYKYLLASLLGVLVVGSLISQLIGPPTIRIGLATTLSGSRFASWGVESRNAVLLAIEEQNRVGGIDGRQLELIVKDDKGDPKLAATTVQELLQEEVVAILGHYLSTLADSAAPFINSSDTVMIPLAALSSTLSGKDDNIIRVQVTSDRSAQALARYITQQNKVHRVAVVYDLSNPVYTTPWQEHFTQTFTANNGKVPLLLPFHSRQPFSSAELADRIIKEQVDGLVVIASALDAASIIQNVRKSDANIDIFSALWAFTDRSFITHGGQAIEGVIGVHDLNYNDLNEHYLNFIRNYENRFGSPATTSSQWGYEAAQILFYALSETLAKDEIKQAILAKGQFDVLSGTVQVNQYGDPARQLWINQIKHGQIITLEPSR